MSGRPMSDSEILEAAKLFSEGLTFKEIGVRLSRDEDTIGRVLRRNGYWKGRGYFSEESIQKMVEMLEAGVSPKDLASHFDTKYGSIYNVLRKRGLWKVRMLGVTTEVPTFPDVHPEWWSEFKGFFYGEGTVHFNISQSGSHNLMLKILLRADDSEILYDIQAKLGGNVRFEHRKRDTRNNNPAASWYITGIGRVYGILSHIADGRLPAKKRRDIQLVREYCEWRLGLPKFLTEEQIQMSENFRQRLIELRRYKTD